MQASMGEGLKIEGQDRKGKEKGGKIDKVKCSFSALPYFLLFKIQLREKLTISEYIILGNNSILCFITFSLNKIYTARSRYDYTQVGLYKLLYETDP